MCKGLVVLYRTQDEATFFVVGSEDENEVILVSRPCSVPPCFILRKCQAIILTWSSVHACALVSSASACCVCACVRISTHDIQSRALGIGSPLLIMSCACLIVRGRTRGLMDLWSSSSLWVHGSRTSALMSFDNPCNCGQHIPLISTSPSLPPFFGPRLLVLRSCLPSLHYTAWRRLVAQLLL